MKAYRMFLPAAVLSFATACGSGNNSPDGGTAGGAGGGSAGGIAGGGGSGGGTSGSGYTVGGAISGSPSKGIVLSDPGQPDFTFVDDSRTFTFADKVPTGTPYNVMVMSVPSGSGENCSVTDAGVGTVGTSNVTRVVVGCTIVLP